VTSVNVISAVSPNYSAPAVASVVSIDTTSATVQTDTANAAPPASSSPTSDQSTPDTAQPGAYNALANANASTIRGSNLNIQA
jgi:hypothetical protein